MKRGGMWLKTLKVILVILLIFFLAMTFPVINYIVVITAAWLAFLFIPAALGMGTPPYQKGSWGLPLFFAIVNFGLYFGPIAGIIDSPIGAPLWVYVVFVLCLLWAILWFIIIFGLTNGRLPFSDKRIME